MCRPAGGALPPQFRLFKFLAPERPGVEVSRMFALPDKRPEDLTPIRATGGVGIPGLYDILV